MDYHQWHFRPPPPPQANNMCPICSNFHFPFCLPPQPSYTQQNPRFPSRPVFDQGPWHSMNSNRDIQNPIRPTYDYYGGGVNGFVSECERHYNKRMRVHECNYQISSENERRLKLIRDHGGGGSENAWNGFNSFENHAVNHSVHVNDWQNYVPNNHQPPLPPLPPPQHGYENFNAQGGYLPHHSNSRGQPPLPTSPPPPMPMEPPPPHPSELKAHPPPQPPPPSATSLFPVPVSIPSSFTTIPHVTEFILEESRSLPMPYQGESQSFPPRQLSPDKSEAVNALHLFKQPHRATRPDHFVIILRGLPGSGKSYIAKMLRDLEVENGGDAPRIHSMDDYFMTEVEKVEESDTSKSSGSRRSKKPMTKKVMEYCYEPEMEEAYRSSMLKAFQRTVEEGNFTFVIVDDRNLRVADFAQFWASAKRLGYEVYILEATYKDPAGCAARNVHGFTFTEIKKMAGQWEQTPSLYLRLDIKSLFHGDDLKESGIKEVDMDMEDEDSDGLSVLQQREPNGISVSIIQEDAPADSPRDDKRWDAEGDHPEVVKDLGRSKWSNDLDEEDADRSNAVKGNLNTLSGLFQTYGKEGKSVRWSDQIGDTGFSIGATRKANMLSLVIGPGAGYNLKSNPLSNDGSPTSNHSTGKSKKQSIFQERLRAEHESFKAVFDRRRHRIGGLELEEE